MKILLLIIYVITAQILFSQTKPLDSLYKAPFDTNKIKDASRLSSNSEVFSYDSLYIWNDKRSLSEIVDARAGYFVNTFNLNGRNSINYNGFPDKNIGVYLDGVQVNDVIFGGFDILNISVNEIDRIEEVSNVSSFLYGVNSNGKSINVLTKNNFKPQPFSQLRYSQDRTNSLYADLNFTLPFSRKFNWMIGLTKHSIDAYYENSESDVWRGRTRLSYYPSTKFNAEVNFRYNNIKRGLNDGLTGNGIDDSLLSATASVWSVVDKEQINNYHLDAGMTFKLFKNPTALTNVKLFYIHFLRDFHGEQRNLVYKDTIVDDRLNSKRYGLSVLQNLYLIESKNFSTELAFGGNVYYDDVNDSTEKFHEIEKYSNRYYSAFVKGDLKYGNFTLSPMIKYDNIKNNGFTSVGLEGNYDLVRSKYLGIKLFAGSNLVNSIYLTDFTGLYESNLRNDTSVNYYETGIEIFYKNAFIKSYFFLQEANGYNNTTSRGVNTSLNYNSKIFSFINQLNYIDKEYLPLFYYKGDYSFHNYFFRNKLNLQVGFSFKYLYTKWEVSFDKRFNYSDGAGNLLNYRNKYYLDFYIGARIGHANINITLANLFDNVYYDVELYPYNNRGGLGNVVSRFTIVWDFLN